ncbi:IPT/TIG domain-containing protein [Sphingobacterium chuzhouense]|uniref:IPT/TIG domain-containing protein n=1 Tax=Sphingobacterium chuzhouense TaxID=1742264 RepID=A0ABR7XS26_9SPHI|nr:IPT/TIG domain-containing protein [Sphingobacterium chuzhouense]MBD1421976.1 IPT/TIG domain-containing protein [Sphingobacterium chuzhouense]
MKLKYLIISLALLFFGGCKKESNDPSIDAKPIALETLAPEVATGENIMLSGRILFLNGEKVLDHGFYLKFRTFEGDTVSREYRMGNRVDPGKVNYRVPDISEILNPYYQYTFYFYVKTDKQLYRGADVTFGISNPNFGYHRGLYATIGEDVILMGNYKDLAASHGLYVGWDGLTEIPFTLKNNKQTLTFKMPGGFSHGQEINFVLRDKDNQHNLVASLASIKVLATLTPPANYEYFFSDRLQLSGPGAPRGGADNLWIIIGDKKVRYYNPLALNDLLSDASGTSFQLGYSNGRDTYIFPEKLKLKQPAADAFGFSHRHVHPKGITIGAGLELNNYGSIYNTSFSLGGKPASFSNHWTGVISVGIGDVPDGTYPLVVKGPILNYTSKKTIKVESLKISSVSPQKAYYLDPVMLRGNFVDGNTYFVKIDGEYRQTSRANNGQITFELPAVTGNAPIEVGYNHSSDSEVIVQTGLTIDAPPSTFEDFTPKSGPPGTVVTLKGRGLGAGRIFFGDQNIYPFEYGSTQVKVEIPRIMTKGKKRLSVFFKTGWLTTSSYFEVK